MEQKTKKILCTTLDGMQNILVNRKKKIILLYVAQYARDELYLNLLMSNREKESICMPKVIACVLLGHLISKEFHCFDVLSEWGECGS